ncbi:hypothetical protein, partial [Klebsiella aerogenes]|uniref:hypothetical protein n=1 Tax=Klebsiella aerogenes TaxID=548 RepID=UPI001CC7B3A4
NQNDRERNRRRRRNFRKKTGEDSGISGIETGGKSGTPERNQEETLEIQEVNQDNRKETEGEPRYSNQSRTSDHSQPPSR